MISETQTGLRIEPIEKVWTPDARLFVPFGESEIAFAYPSIGSDTYRNVGKSLLDLGLSLPTGDQTAALLHTTYIGTEDDSNSTYSSNIKGIMKSRWIWSFQVNNWVSEGVYIQQDSEAKGLELEFDKEKLEGLLNNGTELTKGVRISRDGKVRFAPKDSYDLGVHTPESLAQDGFVIASYSEVGARQLGSVAEKFPENPRTWGIEVNDTNKSEQRVSALLDFNGSRLNVYGYSFGYVRYGHAFGVLK